MLPQTVHSISPYLLKKIQPDISQGLVSFPCILLKIKNKLFMK